MYYYLNNYRNLYCTKQFDMWHNSTDSVNYDAFRHDLFKKYSISSETDYYQNDSFFNNSMCEYYIIEFITDVYYKLYI